MNILCNRLINRFVWLSILCFSTILQAANADTPALLAAPPEQGPIIEGKHYRVIDGAHASQKPKVTEFFSYGCPHCYHLEPTMQRWLSKKPANIAFERVALGLNEQWAILAKAYYIADALDVVSKVHADLFENVHVQGRLPRNDQEIAAIFTAHGVSLDDFNKAAASMSVMSKLEADKKRAIKWRVMSVPAFVINDRYYTDLSMAGSDAMLIKILNKLPVGNTQP